MSESFVGERGYGLTTCRSCSKDLDEYSRVTHHSRCTACRSDILKKNKNLQQEPEKPFPKEARGWVLFILRMLISPRSLM